MSQEAKAPDVMTPEQMHAFVSAYAAAACVADAAAIQSFHAENSISASGQEPGRVMTAADRQSYFEERQWAFPDFHFEATNIVVNPSRNLATFSWNVVATFTNPFRGIPPNRRRVRQTGTTELEIVGGRIVRETSYQDMNAFMQQLMQPPLAANEEEPAK